MGWSVADSDLSLGEDKLSYGFGATGRASNNKQFQLYGEAYGPGDFIGCFVVSVLCETCGYNSNCISGPYLLIIMLQYPFG